MKENVSTFWLAWGPWGNKGTVGGTVLPLSTAAWTFSYLWDGDGVWWRDCPWLHVPASCLWDHGMVRRWWVLLPLSMAVGTFELPVRPGWGRDVVGGVALPLPTSTFCLAVGWWQGMDTVGVAKPLNLCSPIFSSANIGWRSPSYTHLGPTMSLTPLSRGPPWAVYWLWCGRDITRASAWS